MKRPIDMTDECVNCGKKYSPPDFIWHCCSGKCSSQHKHNIVNNALKKFFAENQPIPKRHCKVCGKEYRSKEELNIFCSDECKMTYSHNIMNEIQQDTQ